MGSLCTTAWAGGLPIGGGGKYLGWFSWYGCREWCHTRSARSLYAPVPLALRCPCSAPECLTLPPTRCDALRARRSSPRRANAAHALASAHTNSPSTQPRLSPLRHAATRAARAPAFLLTIRDVVLAPTATFLLLQRDFISSPKWPYASATRITTSTHSLQHTHPAPCPAAQLPIPSRSTPRLPLATSARLCRRHCALTPRQQREWQRSQQPARNRRCLGRGHIASSDISSPPC